MKRNLILISLSSGGFGFQATNLINHLSKDCDFIYMTNRFGRSPEEARVPSGVYFRVPDFQTVTSGSPLTSLWSAIVTFFKSFYYILRYRPKAVIGVAMPQSIFMLMAGRILGKKTFYIESITRTHTPSKSLKICSRLHAARHMLVQWKSLQDTIPGTEFRGRVI